MKMRYLLAPIAGLMLSAEASAQTNPAPFTGNVVAACGTPNQTYISGVGYVYPGTIDTNGRLCINSGGGSTTANMQITTAAPTYAPGTAQPLSGDTAGNLRTSDKANGSASGGAAAGSSLLMGGASVAAGQQLSNGQQGALQLTGDDSALLTTPVPTTSALAGNPGANSGTGVSYVNAKSTAGNLYSLTVASTVTPYYIQYFNQGSGAPSGTTNLQAYEPGPINSTGNVAFGGSPPMSFSAGVTIGCSSTQATFTAQADCTFKYQVQ